MTQTPAPDGMDMVLHGYWRSSAAYRVRIALNLKGMAYRQRAQDLRRGDQRADAYRALAPIGLVPALETGDSAVLTQSLSIIEWLDETHREPPLLPADPSSRAVVRTMAQIVACDIHPLNNLRVLKALRRDFAANDDVIAGWVAQWIAPGFAALETMVAQHGKGFCFGDAPGMADCCLIPQIYNARRFAVDLSPYPLLCAIEARCLALDAFATAAPEAQSDAPGDA